MATETTDTTAGRADPYQLDRRLTILETRFDTILPTLATKADLAELKAELKSEFKTEISGLSRWIVTLTVTMVLGFGGMIATMLSLLRH
jgi:hypothetical protein